VMTIGEVLDVALEEMPSTKRASLPAS